MNSQTILNEMVADIYINTKDQSVTILHDRSFTDELISLDFDIKERRLLFNFPDITKCFGTEIQEDISQYIASAGQVTLLHMNTNSGQAIAGLEVPLQNI